MPFFRKKPIVIEAKQWTGENVDEIQAFVGKRDNNEFRFLPLDELTWGFDMPQVYDELHATWVGVNLNDWIIRGVQGEFYPCRADVFEETYEAA